MTSFISPQFIAALTRQRRTAPGVEVTLPDAPAPRMQPPVHVDDDMAADTFDRNARVAQPTGSGMFRPMETPPDRAGRMIQDVPIGNDDGDSGDPWLRQAARPRVAALPEGTVTDLHDTGAYTRSPAAPNDTVAPNLSYSPAPDRSTIDIGEGLQSPYASRIRGAMELRRNVEADKPRGFWGKVGRTLKGIGEGAIQGAARGGGLGMLAGAVAGGVSPKFADKLSDEVEFQRRYPENVQGENLRFRNEQLERQKQAELRQQANFERQQRATEAEISDRIADNKRLAANDLYKRGQDAETAKRQAELDAETRNQHLFDRRDKVLKESGERVDLADLFTPTKATPNRGQVVPVAQGEAYRLPSAAQQDTRKLKQVTDAAYAKNKADFDKYMVMRPYVAADKEQEQESAARIKASYDSTSDKLDLEGVPTVDKFESVKKDAQNLYGRAQNAREYAQGLPEGDDKKKATTNAQRLQLEADDAMGNLWSIHHHMTTSGGYRDNSAKDSNGITWAGLERIQRTKKHGVVNSASGSAGNAGGGQKTILTAAQVKSYAEANGWTEEQARTYLNGTKKYTIQ